MDMVFLYAAIYLGLLMTLPLYRAVFGPTVPDRMLGVNAIGSKTTVLLVLIGLIYHRVDMFVDIALAYAMLNVVGERTDMIYLGSFAVTVFLTHFMAHSAVAVMIYPLMVAIHTLYEDTDTKTRFGKGLFIGMAYVAGAGSIITLLGAARGAVAIGFFRDIVGRNISFFEYSYYFFPVGWLMMFLIWGMIMIVCKPEKKTIPGLRQRTRQLLAEMGPMSRNEKIAAMIILSCVVVLCFRSYRNLTISVHGGHK